MVNPVSPMCLFREDAKPNGERVQSYSELPFTDDIANSLYALQLLLLHSVPVIRELQFPDPDLDADGNSEMEDIFTKIERLWSLKLDLVWKIDKTSTVSILSGEGNGDLLGSASWVEDKDNVGVDQMIQLIGEQHKFTASMFGGGLLADFLTDDRNDNNDLALMTPWMRSEKEKASDQEEGSGKQHPSTVDHIKASGCKSGEAYGSRFLEHVLGILLRDNATKEKSLVEESKLDFNEALHTEEKLLNAAQPPEVMDMFINSIRIAWLAKHAFDRQYTVAFLDATFVYELKSKHYLKFSKTTNKGMYGFDPDVLECTPTGFERLYITFLYDKQHWVDLSVHMNDYNISIIECYCGLWRESKLKTAVHALANMLLYLFRIASNQGGKNKNSLQPFGIHREKEIQYACFIRQSGVMAAHLIEAHANGETTSCKLVKLVDVFTIAKKYMIAAYELANGPV
ncbi:unnamed protein product [Arabidopsis arenosa]|uniref:Ubiquitin-like protease family profile domain-containing protein n=1 Tax=Arabidopsis arenosa TaxID=38785 RepID=A0A8S2B128_ARAAE|nr:unnamed protein product [Arabidopsis arenosa]